LVNRRYRLIVKALNFNSTNLRFLLQRYHLMIYLADSGICRSCQLCPAAELQLGCSGRRRHTHGFWIAKMFNDQRSTWRPTGRPGWPGPARLADTAAAAATAVSPPPLPVPVRRNLAAVPPPRAGMAAPAADGSYGVARSNHHGSKLLEIVVTWCNLLGGAENNPSQCREIRQSNRNPLIIRCISMFDIIEWSEAQ
jgi:hypothetical protein